MGVSGYHVQRRCLRDQLLFWVTWPLYTFHPTPTDFAFAFQSALYLCTICTHTRSWRYWPLDFTLVTTTPPPSEHRPRCYVVAASQTHVEFRARFLAVLCSAMWTLPLDSQPTSPSTWFDGRIFSCLGYLPPHTPHVKPGIVVKNIKEKSGRISQINSGNNQIVVWKNSRGYRGKCYRGSDYCVEV